LHCETSYAENRFVYGSEKQMLQTLMLIMSNERNLAVGHFNENCGAPILQKGHNLNIRENKCRLKKTLCPT
jgi:hypothetical protein